RITRTSCATDRRRRRHTPGLKDAMARGRGSLRDPTGFHTASMAVNFERAAQRLPSSWIDRFALALAGCAGCRSWLGADRRRCDDRRLASPETGGGFDSPPASFPLTWIDPGETGIR